jgi:glutathione synthase/RimK-type ligase-like ATP-grasp enzyme
MHRKKVITIHQGGAFPQRWLEYALNRGWEARLINGFETALWQKLQVSDALLWHLNHDDPLDLEYARSILYAAELAGTQVYPNHATCWHFDDKISQARLLQAIGAPLASTWIFFTQHDALQFLRSTRYPLVFKLRRGAGSINVRLVPDQQTGVKLVKHMFGRGIRSRPLLEVGKRTLARARKVIARHEAVGPRLLRVLRRWWQLLLKPVRERGYVLFQEYIPGNDHDLRVTVIGHRVFTFRRDVRPNDFRASGSGLIRHLNESEVPRDAVEVSLHISHRLGFQSMAYDYVRDPKSKNLRLLEISCVFVAEAIHDCPGYLDNGTTWRAGHFWPQDLILNDLLE